MQVSEDDYMNLRMNRMIIKKIQTGFESFFYKSLFGDMSSQKNWIQMQNFNKCLPETTFRSLF